MSKIERSNRPYMVRAVYQWIIDNRCTPYISIDMSVPNLNVPEGYDEDGQLVLDIAPDSCLNLDIGNEYFKCTAQFAGVDTAVRFPTAAIVAIYAQENGQGLFFGEPDFEELDYLEKHEESLSSKKVKSHPHLKLIK